MVNSEKRPDRHGRGWRLGCVVPCALLFASGLTRAQAPLDEPESFEGGVPAYVTCTGGELSTTNRYAQDGAKSLLWEWEGGAALELRTGPLGHIGVRTAYGGYSRSAFQMRIYNETPGEGALTFRWYAGARAAAEFSFPLHATGWQRVAYHYSHESKLAARNARLLASADRIVAQAPPQGAGSVYFDAISFNSPIDFRQGSEPITELWQPFLPAPGNTGPDLLAPATEEELAALTRLQAMDRQLYGAAAPTEEVVAGIETKLREVYKLRRLEDGHVVGRAEGGLTSGKIGAQLLAIGKPWLHADDPALKKRLEDAYMLFDDFVRIQGATAQGSIGGFSWYPGRAHADACYIMREPLRRTHRIETVRNCLKYAYGYRQIFEPNRPARMSMDYFWTDARYLLKIALMHDTRQEQMTHVRAFARRYDRQVAATPQPDGALFHHGAHYYAYAGGAMVMATDIAKKLSGTPFRLSRDAYDTLKRAVMRMRWYANTTDLSLSMHGRHPGRQRLSTGSFLNLAEAGRDHWRGRLDPELAAAYLRLVPDAAAKPPFVGTRLEAEPPPQGNLTMPYAALMGHRRDDWLAFVRGYGKHSWAQESYSNANRHGLFFGNGYLDILASGEPINIPDSGCVVARGWDWRYLDGTTAYHAPYARMANGHGTMQERSGVTFMGGLSHAGRNGVFVMPLRSAFQYRKSLPEGKKPRDGALFAADKTFFFFDDRVVCLGAGVALPDSELPVHTTLFQKHLPANSGPESGKVETGSPGSWTRASVSYTAKARDAGLPLLANLESTRNVSTGVIGWDQATVTGGDGKLVNGDFEEGRDGQVPPGWTYNDLPDPGDHGYGLRRSGDRKAGKRVDTTDGGKWLSGGRSARFSQQVVEAMVAGETYEFSVLVQSAGSSYASSRIYFSTTTADEEARPASFPPITVNGRAVTDVPFGATLPAHEPNLLLDTQGTGYYLPAGQKVRVARRHQTSRDGHDKHDTEGDYAVAWCDHGRNPTDAGYEYVVLVRSSVEALAEFADAMAGEANGRPVVVRRRDADAHIVLDRETRTWACVFFREQAVEPVLRGKVSVFGQSRVRGPDPVLPLMRVSGRCLVMVETVSRGDVLLSVGDPGAREPVTIVLSLAGTWRKAGAAPAAQLTMHEAGDTSVAAVIRDGQGVTVRLRNRSE